MGYCLPNPLLDVYSCYRRFHGRYLLFINVRAKVRREIQFSCNLNSVTRATCPRIRTRLATITPSNTFIPPPHQWHASKHLTHPEKRRALRAKGLEQSGFKMDSVTKNQVAARIIAISLVYTLVSGPYGPLTRSYAPAAATPCRDHSDRVKKVLIRCYWVWLCRAR